MKVLDLVLTLSISRGNDVEGMDLRELEKGEGEEVLIEINVL